MRWATWLKATKCLLGTVVCFSNTRLITYLLSRSPVSNRQNLTTAYESVLSILKQPGT